MTKFEVNKTYQMEFVTNSDLKVNVLVIARTEKTITFQLRKEVKRVKVYNNGNEEYFLPDGRYSMSASVYA